VSAAGLAAVEREVHACRRCPRLVDWREEVARVKRAAYLQEEYWGRPAAGFGDPDARLLIFGLAPAAHGANRTGRFFTGDRSGAFLMGGLHRAGYANQPRSDRADDGLALTDAFITAAVRCAPPANRPTPAERDACLPFAVRELAELGNVRVVLCLGAFAWDAALRLHSAVTGAPPPRPRPRFGHGAVFDPPPGAPWPLLGCFHPSQQNTFTGRLTPAMLDDVLAQAKVLAGGA
jgi:uracil-DNA glycosylase family 4